MSSPDSSMDMNSLMEAIYGSRQQTEYIYEHDDQESDRLPQFMQSLINHLIQLCVTQGFADNVQRILLPWVRDVKINYKNPKASLEGFMRDFLRLLRQETDKINKYGEKKLKYLTQTVSRQIFTQIMRMGCDLKLESVNRTNHLRTAHRRANNLTILSYTLDKLFHKDKSHCFRVLKRSFMEDIEKEEKFVHRVERSLDRLNHLYRKARKGKLWKAMSMWRMRNVHLSQEETNAVYTQASSFFHSVLPEIVKAWQTKPLNWINVIIQNLSVLVKEIGMQSEDTEIEFISNPNIQNNSLDYSALSSQRSQRSSLSQLSSISIQTYLQTEQIKYNAQHKFLIIPLLTEQEQLGLIRISWQDQLPIILFHRTARLVELLRDLILNFAKITTRLGYYHVEYENGCWQEELYRLWTRDDVLGIGEVERVLGMAGVAALDIFHSRKVAACCIKYGRDQPVPIPENVYRLIWDKLETVDSFKLDREDKRYEIVKIENGFCRYMLEEQCLPSNQGEEQKSMLIQCIVPLLTKNLGKIGCQACNIKIKELTPTFDEIVTGEGRDEASTRAHVANIDCKLLMDIKDAGDVGSVEASGSALLAKAFAHTPVYAKTFYLADESKREFIYRSTKGESVEMRKIQMPKGLANENVCTVESTEALKTFRDIATVMHQNPLFKQSQIYQYQMQKKRALKIYPKKLGRKALFLLATYEEIPQSKIDSTLETFCQQIQRNQKLFTKQDMHEWISKAAELEDGSDLEIKDGLEDWKDIGLGEIVRRVSEGFGSAGSGIWRVSQGKVIQISEDKQERKLVTGFPLQFLKQEPIRSHQNVKGVHRILRLSKNYGQKLQEHLTYIPNFASREQKLKYMEIISEAIEQLGESADSCYQQVSQFLMSAGKIGKSQFQFISIPVSFQSRTYVTVLIFDRSQQISEERFKAISKYITRVLGKILERKHLQMKQKSLLWFQECQKQQNYLLANRQRELKKVVDKFWQNCNLCRNRNSQLARSIAKMNDGYEYRLIKFGFVKVKLMAEKVGTVYQNACEVLANRMVRVFGLSPILSQLKRLKSRTNAVISLEQTLSIMVKFSGLSSRTTSRTFFDTLGSLSSTLKTSKVLKKTSATKSIISALHRVHRRNLLEYFSKAHQNLISLKRSLLILVQEFTLVSPKTVKACIEFLSGRLNLMLSQHYLMAISVKIINCGYGYRHDNRLLQSQNYIFVRDSSFAFEFEAEKQLNVEQLGKLVEPILYQILPGWEIDHRRHQSSRIRVVYQFLQSIRIRNLKHLFSQSQAERNSNSIEQHRKMSTKAAEQVAKMEELQKTCNPSLNIQRREKHRKDIDQIKQETRTIQNELDRISVETRIKSKTNAAYRMLHVLTRGKENCGDANQGQKLRDVKASQREDVFRHLCEVMPLWQTSVARVIRKNFQNNATHFLVNLAAFYH